MNRLILRYGSQVTAVVLVIFAWVLFQRLARGNSITPLAVAAVVVWVPSAFVFVYFWPRITVGGFKRAIVGRGFGGGPIPVNTLYAVRERSSHYPSRGSLMAVGADDVVYLAGWLEMGAGPLRLHVPEMSGRYYSLQFTDPNSGANFSYVGKRTTGTEAGDFLLCEREWTGTVPGGMTRIDVPHHSALVIGRVFATDDEDRQVAYALAQQIEITPLDDRGERGSATASENAQERS